MDYFLGDIVKTVYFPLRGKDLHLTPAKVPYVRRMVQYGINMAEKRSEELELSGSGWILKSLLSIVIEICMTKPNGWV